MSLKEIRNIIETYDAVDRSNEKLALACVVNVEESSYRRIGARMLVSSSGQWVGGISGGCLEGDALRRAQQAIHKGEPSIMTYDTLNDDERAIGVGLGCNGRIAVLFSPVDFDDPHNGVETLRTITKRTDPTILIQVIGASESSDSLGQSLLVYNQDRKAFAGISNAVLDQAINEVKTEKKNRIVELTSTDGEEVKLLFEYIRPERRLVIIGDNYDTNAMVNIAHELGWEIHLVGKLKKVSKNIFAKAKTVSDYSEINDLKIDEHTAVILMTHDYARDKELLPKVVNKYPGYIGVLGPKKRFTKLCQELNLCEMSLVHAPIGMEIGAESPEEIALSISAEIIATFRKKAGGFLKDKSGSIHDRS